MWIQADYAQIIGEVKERNRYFKALQEIRKIAATNCDRKISLELKKEFKLIVEQCDAALASKTSASE